ncbi:sensor histidine kinase [Glutamicibacter creatinolyticus]|uniref:sensor histidine kinase n=1 Tax=Glutamicibacter creatinolyticus TaxID=162496 RepID=UPI0037BEDDEA
MARHGQGPQRGLRLAVWLLPLLALIGVVVVLFLAPGLQLVVRVPLWLVPLQVGAVAAAACALVLSGRQRAARREREVRAGLKQEADQARRRLLRRLDHELKNPLTVLETVITGSEGGVADAEGWRSVATQTRRLSRLVGDLRGLAELEVAELERIEVDLESLLREVLDDTAEGPQGQEAEQPRISLHLPKAPWPLPRVQGDPDLLRLSLQNLVGNAIKYSTPGDSIEITAQELDGWVIIDIADTGRGIPHDEHQLVLEELARGSNARDQPGSGIGLALVRVIVARHGGALILRSRDGHGTSVSIRLPLQR